MPDAVRIEEEGGSKGRRRAGEAVWWVKFLCSASLRTWVKDAGALVKGWA